MHDALHARAPGSGNTFDGFDAILSNPPYIRHGELAGLAPELDFEPTAALDGGEDGLRFYKAIIQSWKSILRPGGFLVFEVGEGQAQAVSEMLRSAGFTRTATRKDTQGIDRVVIGKM